MPKNTEGYYGTAKIVGDSHSRKVANVEPATSGKPLEAGKDTGLAPPVDIVIHSFRARLADPDGVSAKAAIDELVRSGVIEDDSARFVREVRYRQTKVKNKEDARQSSGQG